MSDPKTSTLPMGHTDHDTVVHGGDGPAHPGDTTTLFWRFFGWSMLFVLIAFFINAVLTISYDWPGIAAVFSDGGMFAAVQIGIYLLAAAGGWFLTTRSRMNTLRDDAKTISDFNLALVRACFFIVLFVGIGDTLISALRVEGILDAVVGADLTRDLGRSQFRGPYFHIPLVIIAVIVSRFVRTLGFHWLTIMIVAAELLIVITRFIFSYEQAFMGDLVRFWYAALFLFASAYTLLEEGHVRVDIFYAGMRNRSKGRVNTLGTLFLGIVLCWTIIIIGFSGQSAVIYGSVANFEVSQSGFGLYLKYFMAAFLGIFAVTMLVQFTSYLMESIADWRSEPGTRLDRAEVAAH